MSNQPSFIDDDVVRPLPPYVTRQRIEPLDLLRQLLELQTKILNANSSMVDPYPIDPAVQDEDAALRAERDKNEERYMEVDQAVAELVGRAVVDDFLLRVTIGQKIWPSEFLQ